MSKITPVTKRWYQSLQRWAGPQAGLKPLALLTAQITGPSRMGCVSTELCPPEDVCSHYLSTVPLYRGSPSRIQAQCQKAWWGVREPKHQMSIPVDSGNSNLWREEVHSLSPAKRYKGKTSAFLLTGLLTKVKKPSAREVAGPLPLLRNVCVRCLPQSQWDLWGRPGINSNLKN